MQLVQRHLEGVLVMRLKLLQRLLACRESEKDPVRRLRLGIICLKLWERC